VSSDFFVKGDLAVQNIPIHLLLALSLLFNSLFIYSQLLELILDLLVFVVNDVFLTLPHVVLLYHLSSLHVCYLVLSLLSEVPQINILLMQLLNDACSIN
jgi:hypothetical protein